MCGEPVRAALDEAAQHRLSHPRLWRRERPFFEVYGRALDDRPGTGGFSTARTEARLAVAVARVPRLDLLASGDRRAVDRAAERYIAKYDHDAASENGRS